MTMQRGGAITLINEQTGAIAGFNRDLSDFRIGQRIFEVSEAHGIPD